MCVLFISEFQSSASETRAKTATSKSTKMFLLDSDINLEASRPWLRRNVSQQQAYDLLKRCENGTFLIRQSSSPAAAYTLSVKTVSAVMHIRIFCSESTGGFFIDGPESGRYHFDCLENLIEFYRDPERHIFVLDTRGELMTDRNSHFLLKRAYGDKSSSEPSTPSCSSKEESAHEVAVGVRELKDSASGAEKMSSGVYVRERSPPVKECHPPFIAIL